MSAEWTAAMVECSDGEYRPALLGWRVTGEAWTFKDGSYRPTDESKYRPLVVIDPEDREQVERLVNAYEGTMRGDFVAEMQHALREFANPTPPRIDEPGTWGVVEAACVHSDIKREWVRFPSGNWHAVRKMPGGCEDIENPDDWDSLVDPVLVRDGVQP